MTVIRLGQHMTVSPRHALAVWRRNFAMYRRSWALNILPNFFEPLLYLVSMGVGVGAYITEMGGSSYLAFLAPGLVAVAAMNGASFEVTYNAFVRLNFEKTYESMLTTPILPDDVLAGEVLWAVTRASIYGGAFLVVVTGWGLVTPLARAAGAAPRAARRPALRRARHRLLAAHPDDRAVQLLLHALPDAAVPVLRRLLPAEGAPLRRLALRGRGAAAAPPGAADARAPSAPTSRRSRCSSTSPISSRSRRSSSGSPPA